MYRIRRWLIVRNDLIFSCAHEEVSPLLRSGLGEDVRCMCLKNALYDEKITFRSIRRDKCSSSIVMFESNSKRHSFESQNRMNNYGRIEGLPKFEIYHDFSTSDIEAKPHPHQASRSSH